MKLFLRDLAIVLFAIGSSVAVLLTPSCASAQDPVPTPLPLPQWTAKEISLFMPMGASNNFNRGNMSRSYNYKNGTFDRVFEEVEEAYNDHQTTDVIYHLPNGKAVRTPMDFDSAVRVKEFQQYGYISILSETTPEHFTWRLGKWMRANDDTTSTIYFGSLVKTETMLKLADEDVGGYYKRFGDSIKFATDIHLQHDISKDRIEIGFDNVGGGIDNAANDSWVPYMPKGSLAHRMIQSVKATGYPVAIEPHFPEQPEYEHLKEFPVIVGFEHWKKAVYNQSVKPNLKHVTVLYMKNSYTDADLLRSITDEHVDKISVAPWLLEQVKRVQQEHADSLEGGDDD